MRARWLASLVQGLVAMLLAGLAVAAEPSGKSSIWGVWLGTNNLPDVDARYRPTPWPALEFTAWGAQESKRLTTPETPDECMPYGPMAHMSATSLFPLEIVRNAKGILIMFEPSSVPRRVYTDGRKHPEELDPTWLGEVLAGRDRTLAAATFSPDGLYFLGPYYDAVHAIPERTPAMSWIP